MPRTAKAKSPPKSPPKPGSAESIRSQAAGLERLAAIAADFQEPKATDVADEAAVVLTAFARAHVRWLRARASLCDPDEDHADGPSRKRQIEVDEAARALLVTPAFRDDMLWRKWEVLEEFVSADATDGGATDNRAVMALGCIKADLIRLGIGHEGDAQ
jgi:hypothetical protein